MCGIDKEMTVRIAKALEKIAEKDFGNKTIHAHRITALRTIEDTKKLVGENLTEIKCLRGDHTFKSVDIWHVETFLNNILKSLNK